MIDNEADTEQSTSKHYLDQISQLELQLEEIKAIALAQGVELGEAKASSVVPAVASGGPDSDGDEAPSEDEGEQLTPGDANELVLGKAESSCDGVSCRNDGRR